MRVLYSFIEVHQQAYPVQLLCSTLQLSRSCYYAWLSSKSRPWAGFSAKAEALATTFHRHKRRYGARRLVAELQEQGLAVSYYLTRKLMREQGLKAIQPRSFIPRTTNSRHPYAISPNLLQGLPPPVKLNQVWVGDITYIPLKGSCWAYLAVWMDLCSRKIVGWCLEEHMREELVLEALQKALFRRKPAQGMVLHSDRGGQYAGRRFRYALGRHQLRQSMSRADDPYDNAFMESFFSRFKAELLQGGVFDSVEDARTEVFEYIEMYYNPIRKHSSLGYKSPARFEQEKVGS